MTLRFQSHARRVVDHLIGDATDDDPSDEDAAFVQRTQDPFLIENDCSDQLGHVPMMRCGAIECQHCGKVFWQ